MRLDEFGSVARPDDENGGGGMGGGGGIEKATTSLTRPPPAPNHMAADGAEGAEGNAFAWD